MANPTIRIFDAETQQTIDREMTDSEFVAYQAKMAEIQGRIDARDNQ